MIPFSQLDQNIVTILEQNNIKEQDLFNYCSDLYIGCTNTQQAISLLKEAPIKSIANTFYPQKGSDMENYPIAVELGFAAAEYHHKQLKK